LIGNWYRPGTLYTQGVVETRDHDFPSLAQGVIIPHGMDDLKKHHGSINLGTSHDTSELACDRLRPWWHAQGQADYPHASSLLVLCEGGGSHGARTDLFKAELERFAQETGLEVRVAHDPAYTSQYNPIEHRLFPHLQRAGQGVLFTSVKVVKELMEKATTKTGLHVSVHLLNTVYTTGRKGAVDFKEQMRVIFDDELPHWNYRVLPEAAYTG
jgi:Rhodopirellula transposase DDE domain